jgi:hypothetical protein
MKVIIYNLFKYAVLTDCDHYTKKVDQSLSLYNIYNVYVEFKSQGLYWCITCPELLCKPCSKYHKALSATEGHVVVSVGKYESLLPILKTMQVKCTEHLSGYSYHCF